MQHGRVETESLHDARTKSLNDDVRCFAQPKEYFAPFCLLEIEGQTLLSPIEGKELCAMTLHPWRHPTPVVSLTWLLDLDDFRSEVGEHLRAIGAGEKPRQIKYADAGERSGGAITVDG